VQRDRLSVRVQARLSGFQQPQDGAAWMRVCRLDGLSVDLRGMQE
jgi:hypothetical protein